EKCSLFQGRGEKGSAFGFIWAPIEITYTKQGWGWTELRMSGGYGSGLIRPDVFRGRLKLGEQGETCCLFQGEGKKGSAFGFIWAPIEITRTKKEWGWTHLRIRVGYGSGLIHFDVFRVIPKIGEWGKKCCLFQGEGEKGSVFGFRVAPIKITRTKQEWGWTQLRISVGYGSGLILPDVFRGRLKLGE